MSLIRQRLLVFLVPLLLALPFLNRAYFVDDSYFVEIASWLKDHPTLPYHFKADDAGLQNRGWEEDGFVRMVNPLVHHYYLAFLLKLGGEREAFLRFGCVLLSCFSALFLFEFSRRWSNHPLLATLLMLVTPTLWLTSYSLLIDSTMVFFVFGSLYFFMRGTEIGALWRFMLSGLLAGLAILSKYPALFVLPLMAVWTVFRWRKMEKPWMAVVPAVIALAMLAAYGYWTSSLYGRPHILAASARMLHGAGWPKVFGFFVFLSGSVLVPLLGWALIRPRARVFAGLFVYLGTLVLASKLGGFSWGQAVHLSLWLVTSFVFLKACWDFRKGAIFPRDHFLVLWLLGFVVMMLMVMDWVAARYFCLVTPAVVWLAVRMVEIRWRGQAPRILIPFISVVFLFTAALATVDYQQAEPTRKLRTQLEAAGLTGGPRHFYLGDSFTMSYLKKDGWVPCFPQTEFQEGDLVIAKDVTMPLIWFARKPLIVRTVYQFESPSRIPLKVMDFSGSAGFYASVWGALPFTFSSGPYERFTVVEVVGIKSAP